MLLTAFCEQDFSPGSDQQRVERALRFSEKFLKKFLEFLKFLFVRFSAGKIGAEADL